MQYDGLVVSLCGYCLLFLAVVLHAGAAACALANHLDDICPLQKAVAVLLRDMMCLTALSLFRQHGLQRLAPPSRTLVNDMEEAAAVLQRLDALCGRRRRCRAVPAWTEMRQILWDNPDIRKPSHVRACQVLQALDAVLVGGESTGPQQSDKQSTATQAPAAAAAGEVAAAELLKVG